MRNDGGFHCGEIAFEAEIDTKQASIFHCTDCQTFGGSAFRVAVVALDGTLKILSSQPKASVKTDQNGTPPEQAFCGNFGSEIYSSWAGNAESKRCRLRVGTIRQRDQLTPKVQTWQSSAQSWISETGSIRAVQTL